MISVVLPVYNQNRQLQLTLDCFTKQVIDERFELIIVDDYSEEASDTIANRFKSNMDIIYLRNTMNKGRSYSRNVGIENSKGDIIVFCDADRYPGPDFLQGHIDFHRKSCFPKTVCIGGVYENISKLPYEQASKQMIRSSTYYSVIRNLFSPDGKCESSVPWVATLSGNMSITKSPVLPRFDEDFEGWGFEHFEFGYRLVQAGYRFTLNDMASNYHIAHRRQTDEYRNSMRNSFEIFLHKHPNNDVLQFGKFIFGEISLQEFESRYIITSSLFDTATYIIKL